MSWLARSIGPWSARAQIQTSSPISFATILVALMISHIGKAV